MNRSHFRSFAAVLLIFFALAVAGFALRRSILSGIGSFLVQAESPCHASLIVVLGGDWYGNRILKAAQLVGEGYAPHVLVSGQGSLYRYHESDVAVDFAVQHGYAEAIFDKLRYPALSTRDEVLAIVRELRTRKIDSVDLVTSDYHTRRAGRIFHQIAPEIHACVVAAPDKYFRPDSWWQNRQASKTLFMEYLKTVTAAFGI